MRQNFFIAQLIYKSSGADPREFPPKVSVISKESGWDHLIALYTFTLEKSFPPMTIKVFNGNIFPYGKHCINLKF